jgi:hypothetical protein
MRKILLHAYARVLLLRAAAGMHTPAAALLARCLATRTPMRLLLHA